MPPARARGPRALPESLAMRCVGWKTSCEGAGARPWQMLRGDARAAGRVACAELGLQGPAPRAQG
eukprot:4725702-Pyramimonas_sp.AAC.1